MVGRGGPLFARFLSPTVRTPGVDWPPARMHPAGSSPVIRIDWRLTFHTWAAPDSRIDTRELFAGLYRQPGGVSPGRRL